MPSCTQCSEILPAENDYVRCNGCNADLHYLCAGVRETQYRKYNSDLKTAWRCVACKNAGTGPLSPRPESTILGPIELQLIGEAVQKAVKAENSAVLNKLADFAQSLDFMHNQLQELQKTLAEKDAKIDACQVRVDELTTENRNLNKANEDLAKRVAHLEQYSRLNCIEIRGVPEPRNENVLHTVTNVANAVNFKLQPTMIDACHRLRQNSSNQQQNRTIIVKFVSRMLKEEFMQAKRVKRYITTKDLDPTVVAPTPVYVNESLSAENKKLFGQCRDFQKVHKIEW